MILTKKIAIKPVESTPEREIPKKTHSSKKLPKPFALPEADNESDNESDNEVKFQVRWDKIYTPLKVQPTELKKDPEKEKYGNIGIEWGKNLHRPIPTRKDNNPPQLKRTTSADDLESSTESELNETYQPFEAEREKDRDKPIPIRKENEENKQPTPSADDLEWEKL